MFSLLNIVLLIIAVLFASLVLLAFFYLLQPVVYSMVDIIYTSLFGEQEVEEEDVFLNDGLVWLFDILKTTFSSLVKLLSKKVSF